MRIKTLIPALLIAILAIVSSCSKTNPTIFTWDYLGRHYVADSSSVSAPPDNKILAYYSVSALGIYGGPTLAVGTYTISHQNTTGQPYLIYIPSGGDIYSESGTLTITYNDGTKMSGSFSATLTDATTISGSFTDIPIR
jgi:hypothetical protein